MTVERSRAIVEAAVVRFVRHGYRRTSMDDLAADLGIGKGTLYLSFASKAAMFDAALAEMQASMIDRAKVAAAMPKGAERDAAVLQALYGDVHAVTSQGEPPWLDEGAPALSLNIARLRVLETCLAPLPPGGGALVDAAARGLRRGLDGAPSPTAAYRASLATLAEAVGKLR